MKKQTGFTLIELLAVIVILAVIALIATPIIMNVINDSKKGAAKDAMYGYIEAVELSAMKNVDSSTSLLNGEFDIKDGNLYNSSSNDLVLSVSVKGSKPTSGTITLANGKVTLVDSELSGYNVTYNGKEAYIGAGADNTPTAAPEAIDYKVNVNYRGILSPSGNDLMNRDEKKLLDFLKSNLNFDQNDAFLTRFEGQLNAMICLTGSDVTNTITALTPFFDYIKAGGKFNPLTYKNNRSKWDEMYSKLNTVASIYGLTLEYKDKQSLTFSVPNNASMGIIITYTPVYE